MQHDGLRRVVVTITLQFDLHGFASWVVSLLGFRLHEQVVGRPVASQELASFVTGGKVVREDGSGSQAPFERELHRPIHDAGEVRRDGHEQTIRVPEAPV